MELHVDLAAVVVTLADPDDTGHLGVAVMLPATASPDVHEDRHRLGDVLAATNVARLAGDHAFVSPDALRFHAEGQVGPDWSDRLDAAVARAATRGWVDPADGWLEAHVTWPVPPPG